MLKARASLWLVPLLFFIAALPNLTVPFTSHGEAREALVVQNMMDQANYILPLRNGYEIPSKPPLFHWCGAAFSSLFGGISELPLRLPSLIFSLFALVALGLAVSSVHSKDVAVLSMLICATSFEWFRSSQMARVDMVFAACISIALWQLYEFVNGEQGAVRFLAISVLLSSAVLAKGPAGLILPLGTIGLYLLPKLSKKAVSIKVIISLAGIGALAAVVSGLWYSAAYLEHGSEFLETQLFKENLARLAGTPGYEVGHEKPFFFAPVELLIGFLPWSLVLPVVIRDLWRRRRAVCAEGGFEWLTICGVSVFLVICAVAVSKRPVYFLPVAPFLSYLTALELDRRERWRKAALAVSAAGIILLFLAGILGISSHFRGKDSPMPFAKAVREKVPPGAPLVQVGENFYSFLFYFHADLPLVAGSAQIPVAGYGVSADEEEGKLCADCEVVVRSENRAGNGRKKLLLIRRR